ncbi:MAG: hypothetical protein ACR2OD_12485, partial [Gaiellaceae bacterium]
MAEEQISAQDDAGRREGSDLPARSKPRVGGMALGNGVLVHGPDHWACAVRDESGELQLASGRKPVLLPSVRSPLVRGLARIAEGLAVVPAAGRALPSAQVPYRNRRMLAVLGVGWLLSRAMRTTGLSPLKQEVLLASTSIVPLAVVLRGSSVAAYHGAEHVTIGSWEHGEPRGRVHERCGSHLAIPIIATTALGNALAGRLARTREGAMVGRSLAAGAAVGLSIEVFGWMLRNRER